MKTSKSFKTLAMLSVFTAASAFSHAALATPSADKFAHTVGEADLFEIKTSQLALTQSQNADIKQFAQQMIDDHTKADANLKTAVASSSLSGKTIAYSLTSDDQLTLNKLKKLSGDDFDKKYVKAQTGAHKDAVKLFTDYSKNGDDDTLKAFAAQTLPVLQEHKDHIKQISDAMK